MADKAWIIGASSFIGIHLAKRLESKGIEVIRYGREEMRDPEGFDVPQVDYIYNLAAVGGKRGIYSDDEMFWTNVYQLFDLFQQTQHMQYKAFIQFGSSSEYGIKEASMREDDVLEPNFMYAATKAAATQLARVFAIQYGKPVVTVRPFSVYGPGMQGTKLIPVLFERMQKVKPINLVEGNHDYIHIDDLLDALDVVVSFAEELKGHAVNIGTGIETSNHEVARLVGEIVGCEPIIHEVEQLPSHHQVDSFTWRANINTLKLFGWRPKISLLDGLISMYEEQRFKA